jgi:hypothetical protein
MVQTEELLFFEVSSQTAEPTNHKIKELEGSEKVCEHLNFGKDSAYALRMM